KSELFAFSSDGRYLLVSKLLRNAVIDLATEQAIADPAEWPQSLREFAAREESLELPFDGKFSTHPAATWAVGTPNGGVWYARGGTAPDSQFWVAMWAEGPLPVFTRELRFDPVAIDWNPRANLLAAANKLGEVEIWNTLTGQNASPVLGPVNRKLWRVAWSQDGNKLLFADDHYRAGQYNYNRFGRPDQEFDLRGWYVRSATTAAPDDMVYPSLHGQLIQPRPTHNPRADASPDADTESLGPEYFDLHLVDPATNRTTNLIPWRRGEELLRSVPNPNLYPDATDFGRPMCFKWFRYPAIDEPHLFVGTEEGQLVEGIVRHESDGGPTFHIVRRFLGHSTFVTSVDFSPDGRLMASSSLDGTIRIWRLSAPRILADVDFMSSGTSVTEVHPNSRAAQAGIKRWDTMERFGETSFFERVRDIQAGKYRPGQSVVVQFERCDWVDGENGFRKCLERQHELKLPLAPAPDLQEPLASIFLSRDGEWVAWTQQGFYHASSRGDRFVGWHVNRRRDQTARFFRFDQYERNMRQPRVLSAAIQMGNAERAAREVLTQLAILPEPPKVTNIADPEQFAEALPPTVNILSPRSGAQLDGLASVEFEVRSPQESAVQQVSLLVNGRTPAGVPERTAERVEGRLQVISFRHQVALDSGPNQLLVTADNAARLQDRRLIEVLGPPQPTHPATEGATLYLLSIGVSEHRDDSLNLTYADKDAQDVLEAFSQQEGRLFSRVVSKLVVNAAATEDGIEDGLHWLVEQTSAGRAEDLAVIFISGHGLYDDSDHWYLVTHDLDLQRVDRTGISFATLDLYLKKIRTRRLLMCDTCHAGGFHAEIGYSPVSLRGTHAWSNGGGRVTFASCLPAEESLESSAWRNGAFSKAIVEFLRGGSDKDSNGDGVLSFDELSLYVVDRVRELTNDQQHPDKFIPPGIRDFQLARP
ncbi:MAG: caspase family protein, partial [Planctomycetaceae bacterium]|nr:caspase family protein [Planctomycetaceae bacterium]